MPGPDLPPFESDITLPDRVDVTIVGGGIIGASTALELAERGLSVLLCEKGRIGGEQSSRNWGWVRASMRDPRELPLMEHALHLWDGLEQRVGQRTGFVKSGILFAALNERTQAKHQRWQGHLVGTGIRSEIVAGEVLDDLLPGRSEAMKSALYTPDDGRAEPQWATHAIASGARAAGATVITACAVRALDLQAGKVAGVVTERGRVACERVVLAGGAWSRLFAGNADVELPQLKVLNTVLRTTPVEGGTEAALWSKGYALRKRADGGFTVAAGTENVVDLVPDSFRLARQFLPAFLSEWTSLRFRLSDRWRIEADQARRWTSSDITAFERTRVLDPAPSQAALRRGWAAARKAFPVLAQADVAQSWAGMIDVTPDAIPVMSGVDAIPGFYIATGFSGHGFGIGPGAGRLMADLVTGASPIVDPHEFRLSRFTDGGPVRIQHG